MDARKNIAQESAYGYKKAVDDFYYDIDDNEIIEAIEFHTTGKPEMTTLGKIVYCADMLEEGRSYIGVERLREVIENDFEKGFVECVNASFKKLIEDNKPFHPLTKSCVEYYNKKDKC